jgi:hypothetical protein
VKAYTQAASLHAINLQHGGYQRYCMNLPRRQGCLPRPESVDV